MPDTLWPPNHKLLPISVDITASDNCDTDLTFALKPIGMNEGDLTNAYDPDFDNTVSDGNTTGDIKVDENGNIFLRAERSGTGAGRIYTITYQATDDVGNTAAASATVTVPHNQ